MKKLFLTLLLSLSLISNCWATSIQVQYTDSTAGEWSIFGATGTAEKLAQSFQVPSNITSDKIELQLVRSGSPSDNTILRVETDNAGVPSGTLIDANATVTVASSGISTSYEWVTFTFPASITIPLGTTYWITLGRDGTRSTVNRIMWVSGTEAFSYAMAIQGSGTWDTASYTGYFCDFRVYGDVVTASTPSMQVIYIQ